MSIQLASTDVLQVVLAAAPATNQLPIHASYVDQGGLGNNLPSLTNGTTAVTFVPSPATGVERLVSQISICNDDTTAANVTVNIVRSGASTRLCKITLQPGYALYYDGGWKVLDTNGNFLCDVTVSSGSITSNQGTAAAITAPWPVQLSNGVTSVGTSSAPLRIDPTGTTTQPVSVTNTVTVGTHAVTQSGSWSVTLLAGSAAIGTVGVTSLPALSAGSNTIGAVTQASGPWTFNLTQVAGTTISTPTAYGTAPASGSVPAFNAYVTNVVSIDPNSMTLSSNASITTTSHQFSATNGFTKLRFCKIDLVGYTNTSANSISIQDGGGSTLFAFSIPAFASATTIYNVFFSDMLAQTIVNTSGGVQAVGTSNPSAGAVYVMVGASN